MAAMNSSVLASNYAISGSSAILGEANGKMTSMPQKVVMPVIRAQHQQTKESQSIGGRRAALLFLTATAAAAASNSLANAGVIDDYLEKSKANKVPT